MCWELAIHGGVEVSASTLTSELRSPMLVSSSLSGLLASQPPSQLHLCYICYLTDCCMNKHKRTWKGRQTLLWQLRWLKPSELPAASDPFLTAHESRTLGYSRLGTSGIACSSSRSPGLPLKLAYMANFLYRLIFRLRKKFDTKPWQDRFLSSLPSLPASVINSTNPIFLLAFILTYYLLTYFSKISILWHIHCPEKLKHLEIFHVA